MLKYSSLFFFIYLATNCHASCFRFDPIAQENFQRIDDLKGSKVNTSQAVLDTLLSVEQTTPTKLHQHPPGDGRSWLTTMCSLRDPLTTENSDIGKIITSVTSYSFPLVTLYYEPNTQTLSTSLEDMEGEVHTLAAYFSQAAYCDYYTTDLGFTGNYYDTRAYVSIVRELKKRTWRWFQKSKLDVISGSTLLNLDEGFLLLQADVCSKEETGDTGSYVDDSEWGGQNYRVLFKVKKKS